VEDLGEAALKSFVQEIGRGSSEIPCLLFPYPKFLKEKSSNKLIRELKKVKEFDLIFLKIHKVSRKQQIDRKHFKRAIMTFEFSNRA